jgi:DedD protein
MEPALKQRLLGAAVLIALAVIFLPMFFSGTPPKSGEQSVSLDIPAQPDAQLQSRVYSLSPEGSGTTAPAHGNVVATTAPMPAPVASVAVPPPSTPVATSPAVTQKPSQPPVAPATTKPVVTTSPGTAADQKYLVSLGVYADRGNAESRLATARKLGFSVYLESVPVSGKAANGVRVGPFSGRATAEAARLKLQDAIAGSRPTLVALDGTRSGDAPASAQPMNQPGGWAVQLAALRDRNDAVAMRNRVRGAGFEAFIDDVKGKDGTWWRVRVGPRTERADAEKLAAEIKAKLGMQGNVVTHP